MITRLPASDRIAVPWKNGGGVTREVAVFPPGAGMDDFDWRISMAEVTKPGPFSRFDGIARHLTVLQGRLQLDFAGSQHVLNPLDSLVFDGDAPVMGTPLEPVLDLNVMTRKGKVSATVRQIQNEAETMGTAVVIELDSLDAVLIEGGETVAVDGPGLLVEFTATDRAPAKSPPPPR